MKQPHFRIKPFRPSEPVHYFLIAVITLAVISFFLGFKIFIAVFLLILVLSVFIYFDTKSKIRSAIEELEINGMIPCDTDDLDPEFLDAIGSAMPYTIRPKDIEACVMGSLHEREIVLIVFSKNVNDEITYFVGCGVWSPAEWPSSTIRLRSPLIDFFIGAKKIGDPTFDKRRRLVSSQPELVASMLRSLIHWFPETNNVYKSFRMSPSKVTFEQWRLKEHWVFMCDAGETSAENLTSLGEYLIGFTTEAEEYMNQLESG